jgi:hypothetical protein
MAEVKKVLLLGQKDYIEKEWKDLNDFQDVYFMEVNDKICFKVLTDFLSILRINFGYFNFSNLMKSKLET